ncbi:TolC family protein, partial [Tamlana crocina]
MKNILISPLVLLLFWTGITSAQDTLYVSLEETVASAVTGNPDILISRLEVERAISQLKAANGAFLPNIGVDGQYVRNIKRPVFFLPPGEGFGGQQGDERGTVIEAGYDNSFNMTAQATLPLYNQSIIASSRAAR